MAQYIPLSVAETFDLDQGRYLDDLRILQSEDTGSHMNVRPFWPPLMAGIALGLVLLMSFLLTGHGLGASGFFTRLTAWFGGETFGSATAANPYLGPFLKAATHPVADWITWEIVGVMLGALLAAVAAGRFRWKLDGAPRLGGSGRIACAIGGGILIAFFISGIAIGWLVRRAWA